MPYKRPGKYIKNTGWDNVAKSYDRQVSREGSDYHLNVIIPGLLELLKPQKGEKVLDLACGQGVLCRKLAEMGAMVTGTDASAKLIDRAKKYPHRGTRIDYLVADAAKLSLLPGGHYDKAACVLALQNMDQLEPAIKEVSRVLKPQGKFLIVLNHPCFRIPRQSGWGIDEQRKLQYRRVDTYMSELKIPIQMHPGSAPDIHTWSFHRPLSVYINALAGNGLYMIRLEEWISHRQTLPGKDKKMQDRARQEIPMFLALLGEKKFK